MLEERDAEIALSPGFRWGGTLLPGDTITFEALTNATAMTYPNCYRNEMTGEQLKEVLEDVADNIFHPDPYFQGGGDMVRDRRPGLLDRRIQADGPAHLQSDDLKTGKPIDAEAKLRRRRLGQHQREHRGTADLGCGREVSQPREDGRACNPTRP